MSKAVADHSRVLVRQAGPADAEAMADVESSAKKLLESQGVDLSALQVPAGLEEAATWSWAFVAETGGEIIGMARLTELSEDVVCLDQISVSPHFAGQGVGRQLLTQVATAARERGYSAITGTTFRDVAFNAPFYSRMGCVEEPDPHPAMVEGRRVEHDVGLDACGPRLIMRLPL